MTYENEVRARVLFRRFMRERKRFQRFHGGPIDIRTPVRMHMETFWELSEFDLVDHADYAEPINSSGLTVFRHPVNPVYDMKRGKFYLQPLFHCMGRIRLQGGPKDGQLLDLGAWPAEINIQVRNRLHTYMLTSFPPRS